MCFVRKTFIVAVILCTLAIAPLATAHDLLPPSWRGTPGTSTLCYDNNWLTPDYFTSYGGGLAGPKINYQDGWTYWDGGIFGMPGYGWQLPWGNRNSRLIFEMDNYDNNNLQKDIRVQVTFYAPNFYQYNQPWSLRVWANSNDPWNPGDPNYWDGSYDIAYSSVQGIPGYNGWMCAAFDLQLRPNPDSETIGLDFGTSWPWWYYYPIGGHPYPYWAYPGGGSVIIDQVVIDTRCVPEPVTMTLLALGGVGLLLKRRRNRA